MAGNVFFRVHEHKVQEFLMPGQPVNDVVYRVALDSRKIARTMINSRTGHLSKFIQVNRPAPYGALKISSLVFTRTKHAFWVHEGTNTIFPKKKKGMLTIPRHAQDNSLNLSGGTLRKQWRASHDAFEGGKPYFTARKISGQRANPYLRVGMEKAMAKERGLSMT